MSRPDQATPLWVIGAVIGAFAAVIALGPRTIAPALVAGGGAIAYVIWRRWRAQRARGSVLSGLRAHWAMLPGATWAGDVITVHHGDQPIRIHLSHSQGSPMRARVATSIGEQPMAFRVWRSDQPPLRLAPDGRTGGEPQLIRSPLVESWLAGRFQAESNDEERLAPLIGQDVTAALFSLADILGTDFEGAAYDGQHLTVALRGTVVADPTRAMQLARVVWRTFVP